MKTTYQAFRMLLVMTLLTGGIYPLLVTATSQVFFKDQANGQLVRRDDKVIASRLIAQKITSRRYFWPRLSGTDYNAAASSGTNLGPTSADLKKQYDERTKLLQEAHTGEGLPPQDLLFASGSGLDPEISPAAAFYQLNRVAGERNLNESQKAQLKVLIEQHVQKPTFGFIGEARVNVMDLNLALDKLKE